MSQPTFSIVLLTRNNAWCIEDALASVARQSLREWECIICDDASSDGTNEIVNRYLQDPRFIYYSHPQNLGQAGNWEFGINQAQGRFVATLHADDVWLDNALAVYFEGLGTSSEVSLVLADYERCNADLLELAHQSISLPNARFSRIEAFEYLLKTNFALPSASAFRRELALQVGPPYGKYGMLCDRDFLLRLAAASPVTVIDQRRVAKYRVHSRSVTTEYNINGKLAKEMVHFNCRVAEIVASMPEAERLVREYRKSSAEYFFRTAMSTRVAREWKNSFELFRLSINNNPRLLLRPSFALKALLYFCSRRTLAVVHGRNKYVTRLRTE